MPAQNSSQSNFAVLQGSVTNKITGAPVNHAHVMYIKVATGSSEAQSPISTDTDAQGNYTIQVEPGPYRLWVERPGFARQPYGSRTPEGSGTVLTLIAGQKIRDLNIRIVPLGAISGRTLDDEGEPVQGVGVQVLRFSYAIGKKQLVPVAGASSNDRGEYRIYSLPAGRYYLLATLHGAPMAHPPEPGGLVPEMLDPYAALYYPGVLDFTSATQIPLPEGGEASDIDFSLQRIRAVTVRGRVLSPVEDSGNSQLQVMLARNEGNAASSIGRLTAAVDRASGRFEFRGVAPGQYLLIATQASGKIALTGREAIEVSAAGQDNLRISLAPAFELSGRVEVEGGLFPSLSSVTVRLTQTEGLAVGLQPVSKVAADGSLRLPGVTAGTWELTVDQLPENVWIKSATYGDQDLLHGDLNASAGPTGQLHIVLAGNGAQVSGTVMQDGQPHHATIVLAPAETESRTTSAMYRMASTQKDGAFVFKGVRPGSYRLFAFEEVEPFAWLDPDFLKPVETLGEFISISEGEKITKQLTPIPPEALLPSR